jgi:hypothetical protein
MSSFDSIASNKHQSFFLLSLGDPESGSLVLGLLKWARRQRNRGWKKAVAKRFRYHNNHASSPYSYVLS